MDLIVDLTRGLRSATMGGRRKDQTMKTLTHLEAIAELGFVPQRTPGSRPGAAARFVLIPEVERPSAHIVAFVSAIGTRVVVGSDDLLFVVKFDEDTPGSILMTALDSIMLEVL